MQDDSEFKDDLDLNDDLSLAAKRLLNRDQLPEKAQDRDQLFMDAQNCIAHFRNHWRDKLVNPLVAEWVEEALDDLLAMPSALDPGRVKTCEILKASQLFT